MSKGLFITGTGTDVGKTFVSGLIVDALRRDGASAAYYKAAMSGNQRRPDGTLIPGDALYVKKVSGLDQPLEEMCPYVYEHAVSPHLAGQLEGGPVCLDRVLQGYQAVCRRYDYITMEGSGGILCPLRFDGEELWLTDVIRACGLGCLLVADAGLGAINAVGLTASYLDRQGIPLKGIIFNRFQPGNRMHEDNVKLCEHLTGVRAAALVRDGDTHLDIPAERLRSLYE